MAKALKPGNGADSANQDPKHNVANRDSLIKSSMEELYQADRRIKASLEKHVTPDRNVKTDIKKRLREDLELTTPVINSEYSRYALQRKAQDADDSRTLDLLREMQELLPVGATADMVAAAEQATAEAAQA